MFKHILCPTDLGERAFLALEKAVFIAHQFDATITMLNVHGEFMDKHEMEMLRVSVNRMKEKFKQTAVACREKMKKAISHLHADDIEVAYLLREGKPETVIPEVARELEIDLIVICTDGRDNIKDFIAGTLTERVINSRCCPVLVVPFP